MVTVHLCTFRCVLPHLSGKFFFFFFFFWMEERTLMLCLYDTLYIYIYKVRKKRKGGEIDTIKSRFSKALILLHSLL